MSEERFQRIEEKIDGLTAGQTRLENRVDRIEGRLDQMDGRLDKMDGRLDKMDGRLDKMDGRLDKMDGRLDKMDGRLDNMDEELHRIGITQEDMRDQIKVIAESHASTQLLIRRVADEILEAVDRRLVPLEAAFRNRG